MSARLFRKRTRTVPTADAAGDPMVPSGSGFVRLPPETCADDGSGTVRLLGGSRASAEPATVVLSDRMTARAYGSATVSLPNTTTANAVGMPETPPTDDHGGLLPDVPSISPPGEVYVPAGTTTTASGRRVPRAGYTRRKQTRL